MPRLSPLALLALKLQTLSFELLRRAMPATVTEVNTEWSQHYGTKTRITVRTP